MRNWIDWRYGGQGRLASFNICNKLLRMFYQSLVASALFYAGEGDGQPYVCGRAVEAEQAIMDNPSHHTIKVVLLHAIELFNTAMRKQLGYFLLQTTKKTLILVCVRF